MQEFRPWPAWTAPVALIVGLVLAVLGAVVVDIPAAALGVSITTSHTPPGITLADTFVQDAGFILAAVFCGHLGGRAVHAWQLGLRPPTVRWRTVVMMVVGVLGAFILLDEAWVQLVHPGEDKILEQLGSGESATLLVLSALITCVVAPICEEILFRGYIFTALRGWSGTLPAALITGVLFGAVHAGSAPALDLRPAGGARLRAVPAVSRHRLAVSVLRGAFAEQHARLREPRKLQRGRMAGALHRIVGGDRGSCSLLDGWG